MSTEGLVLFGPGSEWFWSMLQFVVVAITLVGILVQLRQARAANAFAQASAMEEQWQAERMVRRRLALAIALRDQGPQADLSAHSAFIGNFWEGVAALVRAGHVEIGVVRENLGGSCLVYWLLLEPEVRALRTTLGPDLYEHFEWLAEEIVRYDEAHVPDRRLTREFAVATSVKGIPALRASVADLEAMRTTTLVATRPADVVSAAAAGEPTPTS